MVAHGGKLLVSTNTELAYHVNTVYYGGSHYVWCCRTADRNPPSSDPMELARDFARAIANDDRNALVIKTNREGVKKGADAKLAAGVITPDQSVEIYDLVDRAPLTMFRPLIYTIYGDTLGVRCVPAPLALRASDTSSEMRIFDLQDNEFELLPFPVEMRRPI